MQSVGGGLTLELALSERRSISGNDDELGLARSECLECGLVTQCD